MTKNIYIAGLIVLLASILLPFIYLQPEGRYLTQAGAAAFLVPTIVMLVVVAFSNRYTTQLKARRVISISAAILLTVKFITNLFLIDLGNSTWTIYGLIGNGGIALALVAFVFSLLTLSSDNG